MHSLLNEHASGFSISWRASSFSHLTGYISCVKTIVQYSGLYCNFDRSNIIFFIYGGCHEHYVQPLDILCINEK